MSVESELYQILKLDWSTAKTQAQKFKEQMKAAPKPVCVKVQKLIKKTIKNKRVLPIQKLIVLYIHNQVVETGNLEYLLYHAKKMTRRLEIFALRTKNKPGDYAVGREIFSSRDAEERIQSEAFLRHLIYYIGHWARSFPNIKGRRSSFALSQQRLQGQKVVFPTQIQPFSHYNIYELREQAQRPAKQNNFNHKDRESVALVRQAIENLKDMRLITNPENKKAITDLKRYLKKVNQDVTKTIQTKAERLAGNELQTLLELKDGIDEAIATYDEVNKNPQANRPSMPISENQVVSLGDREIIVPDIKAIPVAMPVDPILASKELPFQPSIVQVKIDERDQPTAQTLHREEPKDLEESKVIPGQSPDHHEENKHLPGEDPRDIDDLPVKEDFAADPFQDMVFNTVPNQMPNISFSPPKPPPVQSQPPSPIKPDPQISGFCDLLDFGSTAEGPTQYHTTSAVVSPRADDLFDDLLTSEPSAIQIESTPNTIPIDQPIFPGPSAFATEKASTPKPVPMDAPLFSGPPVSEIQTSISPKPADQPLFSGAGVFEIQTSTSPKPIDQALFSGPGVVEIQTSTSPKPIDQDIFSRTGVFELKTSTSPMPADQDIFSGLGGFEFEAAKSEPRPTEEVPFAGFTDLEIKTTASPEPIPTINMEVMESSEQEAEPVLIPDGPPLRLSDVDIALDSLSINNIAPQNKLTSPMGLQSMISPRNSLDRGVSELFSAPLEIGPRSLSSPLQTPNKGISTMSSNSVNQDSAASMAGPRSLSSPSQTPNSGISGISANPGLSSFNFNIEPQNLHLELELGAEPLEMISPMKVESKKTNPFNISYETSPVLFKKEVPQATQFETALSSYITPGGPEEPEEPPVSIIEPLGQLQYWGEQLQIALSSHTLNEPEIENIMLEIQIKRSVLEDIIANNENRIHENELRVYYEYVSELESNLQSWRQPRAAPTTTDRPHVQTKSTRRASNNPFAEVEVEAEVEHEDTDDIEEKLNEIKSNPKLMQRFSEMMKEREELQYASLASKLRSSSN